MKRNFNIFGMQNSLRGKIYKKNVRIKTVVLISVAVLLICIMITVGIFFWFRQYIVYTSDGLYLDVPWLRDAAEAAASAGDKLAGNIAASLSAAGFGG